MTVITSQLISSPTLQDELVSKLGLALSSGVVTFYESDMATYKNWYYQSGTGAGPFTYIAGSNPLTLSAAGTFVDVGGNDVIPFWNPWSETDPTIPEFYFVTVFDQLGVQQFTRSNFPFGSGSGGGGGGANTQTLDNYVINNRFWRNVGSVVTTSGAPITNTYTLQYNSTGTYYNATLAPSQHDSFSMPDLVFIVNNTTASDTITFDKFALALVPQLTGDITPEYYINHTTSVAGTGETLKVYQFPISLHIETLSEVTFAFTIQTQSAIPGIILPIYIYQFLGTGVASGIPQQIGQVTTTTTWAKTTLNYTFNTDDGLILSTTSDDAWYLQIGIPRNVITNFNFTLPSIYLSSLTLPAVIPVPTNDFQTYDQIDTIINSWRTGDVRTSLNSFYFFGWVPMNDGAIGYKASAPSGFSLTRNNQDTWPLYNLIWNSFAPYSTGNSTSSGVNLFAQMYTASGVAVGYGPNVTSPTTAYTDWVANKFISLSNMMGQVVLGTVPPAALISLYATTFTTTNDATTRMLVTATNNVTYFNGMPIQFSTTTGVLPSPITANTIYYVAYFNGTNTFYLATTFAAAMAANNGGAAIAANTITWASNGTPPNNMMMAPAGTYEGEYAHTQLLNEIMQHTHDANAANFADVGSGGVYTAGAAGGSTAVTAGIHGYGTQAAFNVTQPGTMMNIYMKL